VVDAALVGAQKLWRTFEERCLVWGIEETVDGRGRSSWYEGYEGSFSARVDSVKGETCYEESL
jgi:hypothetical protein